MKKLLLSILTLVYLAVSSGIAMEVHYCMGKKAGVDFYGAANDKCSRCGMTEKKDGCCNDQHKFYKLADEHKNVFNNYNASVSPVIIVTGYNSFSDKIISPVKTGILQKEAPPGSSTVPVFIRNCVFRI